MVDQHEQTTCEPDAPPNGKDAGTTFEQPAEVAEAPVAEDILGCKSCQKVFPSTAAYRPPVPQHVNQVSLNKKYTSLFWYAHYLPPPVR